uniref:Uncharacterized protein n=1 Tax=Arundo donax TaxID=35708 RepID=A0A0A9EDE7_ARUDO
MLASFGGTPLATTATTPFSTTAFGSPTTSSFWRLCFPSMTSLSELLGVSNFLFIIFSSGWWRLDFFSCSIFSRLS